MFLEISQMFTSIGPSCVYAEKLCVRGLVRMVFIVLPWHEYVETLTSSKLLTVCTAALIARSSLVWHRSCQVEYVKHKESEKPLPGLSVTHPHQPPSPLHFKPSHSFYMFLYVIKSLFLGKRCSGADDCCELKATAPWSRKRFAHVIVLYIIRNPLKVGHACHPINHP